MKFAPNNLEASKTLFTGRTEELNEIFKLVCSGNCIALYGERKSGKTLTLVMIKEIINKHILRYKKELIDKNFCNKLSDWINQFTQFKAIYVSLHGTRTEEELIYEFCKALEEERISLSSELFDSNNEPFYKKLNILLDKLQEDLKRHDRTLVVLLDEMEILGEYENDSGDSIAELFCNTANYSKIHYIHAGSYQWKENVTSPGSLFTHLVPHYLHNINQQELVDFLLAPLPEQKMKDSVAEMTGGKPLYAQIIAKLIVESGKFPSETELLNNPFLCEQIKMNIYEEARLDDVSKKILATLAHRPRIKKDRIAVKLHEPETVVKNKLSDFVNFGTILNAAHKYQIVGSFIERYGKEICDDPTQEGFQKPPKSLKDKIVPIIKWGITLILITIAIGLYFYPILTRELQQKRLDFSQITISMDMPNFLEPNESGILHVSVTNRTKSVISPLKLLFSSQDIRYEKDKKNSLIFSDIEPNETGSEELAYTVLPGKSSLLNITPLRSKIIVSSEEKEFDMKCLPFSFKGTNELLSIILGVLGVLVHGKSLLASFVSLLGKWLSPGKE